MNEMGGAGFVTGVVLGAVTSIAFLVACLYSAYKAIKDRRRILIKNENIRAHRLDELAEMGEQVPIEQNHTTANHLNGTAGAASSASLATPGGTEERRPSAAFKPPPAPPEKQWDQKGVHYRSEGGVMHIHKSDSKLSTGPGDETEKQPLMSAPDDLGASSDDNKETETVPPQVTETTSSPTAATDTTTTTAASSTTNDASDASETTVQVHVTVSVTEHQDQVVTSTTSVDGLKSVDASADTTGPVGESANSTQVRQKLFTSTNLDGTRTQTGTELPEVTNGNSSSGDPAAWV